MAEVTAAGQGEPPGQGGHQLAEFEPAGRDRLTGTVEVDETYIGGDELGPRGGRANG